MCVARGIVDVLNERDGASDWEPVAEDNRFYIPTDRAENAYREEQEEGAHAHYDDLVRFSEEVHFP